MYKSCPVCGEKIWSEAVRCKFCKQDIDGASLKGWRMKPPPVPVRASFWERLNDLPFWAKAFLVGSLLVATCLWLVVLADMKASRPSAADTKKQSSFSGTVQFKHAYIDYVMTRTDWGTDFLSREPKLIILLGLTNLSSTRKMDYSSWSHSGLASMTDDLGNDYSIVRYPRTETIIFMSPDGGQFRATDFGPIHPNITSTDALVVERPVRPAKVLYLTLSASNFGGKGNEEISFTTDQIKGFLH
jgi:hypothetical protein